MKKIISLLMILMIVFSFSGCKNNDDSTEATSTTESTTEAESELTPEKIDYDNLVIDAYSYEYSDDYGEYEYNIPKIMLEGENVEIINDEIWDWCYENAMSDVLDIISAGTSVYLFEISYEWAVNEDILSLCVAQQWDANVSNYKVYNVNINTGETVSKDELLSCADFSYEEYIETAKEAIGSEYLNYYDFDNYSDVSEFAEIHGNVLEKTLSDENINNALPFINNNGELCIVCVQYSSAGADIYYRVYNLESFDLNLNYLEVINSKYLFSENSVLETEQTSISEQTSIPEWKTMYIDYIETIGSIYNSYEIAYVDNDDVPEIFLSSESAIPGQAILWIADGSVHEKSEIGYGSVHYYEKQNLFCTSWMNHGNYADVVYSLNNGEVTQLHIGSITDNYMWDNQEVNKEQYDAYLSEAFIRENAREVKFDSDIIDLLDEIKNM